MHVLEPADGDLASWTGCTGIAVPPGLLLFLFLSPFTGQVPSLQPRQALCKSGYRNQGMGKGDTGIDQCVRAGNWDLRELIAGQAGMDFYPRGKAGDLLCSVISGVNAGKTAVRWSAGSRIGGHSLGTRLGLGLPGPQLLPKQMVCLANIVLLFTHYPKWGKSKFSAPERLRCQGKGWLGAVGLGGTE